MAEIVLYVCISLAIAALAVVGTRILKGVSYRLSGMHQDMARLAMVAERTFNAVYFCDTGWRITWINEGFTRMSGFSSDEALGKRPSQLLHSPLADPLTPDRIDALAEIGQRVEIQVLQRNKDGRDYWVDLEVMPITDAQGKITGYMSVQSDVTEEVRAKAALLLEKERADNILSGTNVGTWESNLLTNESRWNDRWSAMMGFSRQEVLPGLDPFWQQRVHPADRDRMNQAIIDCVAGRTESLSCDVRVLHKSGNWMWVLCRAKVMSRNPEGRAEWIGGINTDITEIKQVELSLRDMEGFLDRAGRMAGLGAWQIELKTRAVTFSPQTCAIHGLAADFQPTEEVAMSFYPEPGRQLLRDAMLRAERDGTPWDMVVEFCNAQGQQLWVRSVGEVGFDDSGPVRLVGAFQDVTQDHLSQLEVERSSALLRGAIEAIDEAFVLFDPQDRMVFCNDKYRAIYAKSSDLMRTGETFENIIRGGAERGQYAEAVGRVDAWVQERMAMHRSGSVATEQRLDDGRCLKVIERRMPDGHMVGFRVDITELKQATAAAEEISAKRGEEQQRLQSILEGTHVGTWEWNAQTGDSMYNDQYVGMLGYTLQELEPLGHATWKRLVHPEDLLASAALMRKHLRGEIAEYEIEVRMQHKEGHWIWVLAKGKLTKRTEDGRPLWVYGTHMDITERKRAEQQLAQTTAMLQNVLDSATAVGVITLGLDHGIKVFNKGAENLLGFAAQELVERQLASAIFDPAELDALAETLELAAGQMPDPHQVFAQVVQTREEQAWTLLRKDGSRFKASLIFSPMHDVLGNLEGHLAVIYDISKQKEYESSLREAMHLAEQSSVAKSQFLANMSHEIRTPMNAILGMLQLMRGTSLDAQQHDYTDKAMGAARSLLGLLNDILDFSKVEAGKMQLNPEPFLLENLLGDLSVILSSNLGARKVDLLFEVDPDIPRELVGDAMRLKQILINLGGNAVKFTEQGEVVIRWTLLSRTPDRIRLGVAVVDSGIGIAPENQARIFEGFTQAEANTTRRFGGTGLGLVISTRLIRLMGGELGLQSSLNQGSTFSFTLDLKPVDFAQVQTASDAARSAQPAARVLLVDDSVRALASSASMMRSLGWVVHEATSGAAAVDWLRAEQAAGRDSVDGLFVNAEMAGMDGWDTVRAVRRQESPRAKPALILLSRQGRDGLVQRSEREYELLDGLLVKPVTAPMFAKALAQAQNGAQVFDAKAPTVKRLDGMHILLVEDNMINQQVAQELLQAEGARVVLADNGALGLTAIYTAEPAFDVVLMDLQMPVMDGLSATRQLRADARYAHLPVIAMTANAMHSDREECLQAGMNDHIGKPFDLGQLVQTLIAHTHWLAVAAPAVTAPPKTLQESWPEGIAVDQALARMGGNRQLLARAMHAFVADAVQLPQRLQQSLEAGQLQQLNRDLHSLKGLSATLGMGALSSLAAQAEKMARIPDAGCAMAALLERLHADLAHLSPQLELAAWQLHPVDRRASTESTQLSLPADMARPLAQLLVALNNSDMAAMELHAKLQQRLGVNMAKATQVLDQAMAELDFEAAARACEALHRQLSTTTEPIIQ